MNTFRWALTCGGKVPIEEGLEHPELPDGTGEFLDAWLMLLEKLVNPKNVLESPHTLPFKPNQPGNTGFNPLLFIIHIHKRAFECILYLWDRRPLLVYGERIAESILSIICHILKGERIIKEKLSKGEDIMTPTAPASGATTVSTGPASTTSRIVNRSRHLLDGEDGSVNQDHLTQLVDMGFSRSLATEALLNTLSLEQATDYLLSYPASVGRNSATPDTTPEESLECWNPDDHKSKCLNSECGPVCDLKTLAEVSKNRRCNPTPVSGRPRVTTHRQDRYLKECGTRFEPRNITERHHFSSRGVMVRAGIIMDGCTDLHFFDMGCATAPRYRDEVLEPYVRLFRGAVDPDFIFMDDNAPCHRAVLIDDFP
ncbi:e3 ubiquitin-protein ligase HUWE1 [Trichonephila clavipes]|nr:e3 ubiquitin-protein ligase HUWE1 [Trichonephila clavipes]